MSSPSQRPSPRLFVKSDGNPVKFYLYDTLTAGQRQILQNKIEQHGGVVHNTEEDANVVIASPEQYDPCKYKHSHSKTVYVELAEFVHRCIHSNNYVHDKPIFRRMGGSDNVFGRARTPFTQQDDQHLTEYLANRIPDKTSGGRTGNGVYKELMDMADKGFSYGWAKRHTWQSWRERYKMNQEWFDEQITEHLDAFPPHPHGKGEYALKRMPRAPRTRQIASRPIPENSEDNEEGILEEQMNSAAFEDNGGDLHYSPRRLKQSDKSIHGEGEDNISPEQARGPAHRRRSRTPEAMVAGPSQPRRTRYVQHQEYEPVFNTVDQTLRGGRVGDNTQGPPSSQMTLVETQSGLDKRQSVEQSNDDRRNLHVSSAMPPLPSPSGTGQAPLESAVDTALQPEILSPTEETHSHRIQGPQPTTPRSKPRSRVARKRPTNSLPRVNRNLLDTATSDTDIPAAQGVDSTVANLSKDDASARGVVATPPSVIPPSATLTERSAHVSHTQVQTHLLGVDSPTLGAAPRTRTLRSVSQATIVPRNKLRKRPVSPEAENNEMPRIVRRSARLRSQSVEPASAVQATSTRRGGTDRTDRLPRGRGRTPSLVSDGINEGQAEVNLAVRANNPAQEDVITLPETIAEENDHSMQDVEAALDIVEESQTIGKNLSEGKQPEAVIDMESDDEDDVAEDSVKLQRMNLLKKVAQLGNGSPSTSPRQPTRRNVSSPTPLPGTASRITVANRRSESGRVALGESKMANTTATKWSSQVSSVLSDESNSESDFPIPGTKARAIMEREIEEELNTPFSPAEGTRAAEYQARQLKQRVGRG